VRPVGHDYLKVKVLYTPDEGKYESNGKVSMKRSWLKVQGKDTIQKFKEGVDITISMQQEKG
jgi:hypothetical protein